MKRTIIFFGIFCLVTAATVHGFISDAPHNESNNISCGSCHNYSLWWEFSPASGSQQSSVVNSTCMLCHNDPLEPIAPYKKAHSSLVLGEAYGVWSTDCINCHNPHFQEQLEWIDQVANEAIYLAEGLIGDPATFVDNGNGTTTFAYTLTSSNPDWSIPDGTDPDDIDWGRKNDNPSWDRGLILVEDTIAQNNTFLITSADDSTITVQGELLDVLSAANATFGLAYGQLIKRSIETVGGPREVKFFNPYTVFPNSGGYVDGQTPPQGICQVCHTQTGNWTADGINDDHHNTMLCTQCHNVDEGYSRPIGPAHTFLVNTSPCTDCHQHSPDAPLEAHSNDCQDCHTANPPELRTDSSNWEHVTQIGLDPTGAAQGSDKTETACIFCHTDYFSGHTHSHSVSVQDNTDKATTTGNCSGCHEHTAITPPFTGSGEVHAQQGCETCHDLNNAGSLKSSVIADATANNRNGGECAVCHWTYFDGHDHGNDTGNFNHYVSYDQTIDQSEGEGCGFSCHAGQVETWDAIRSRHYSSTNGMGACATCHNSTDPVSRTNDPAAPQETVADVIARGGSTDPITCLDCHYDNQYHHVSHINLITSYDGATTCLGCHPNSATGNNMLAEVMGSVHFQLRTANPDIDMPGGGMHGMYDRACGLPGTTAMANNYANIATSPIDGSTQSDGCGKCHIAKNLPGAYFDPQTGVPDMAAVEADIDCLVCHAASYDWANRTVTGSPGSYEWTQDTSLAAAQSVGKVTSHACERCHHHGMGPYKRSTPIDPTNDVHAAAGMECTECHTVSEHKIARGNRVTDGVASEMPGVEVDCINCHDAAPHANSMINYHANNVACEACHITELAGDSTNNIFRRSWAPFTLDPVMGTWEDTPPATDNEYPGFWDAYTEYSAAGQWPTIRWFDGRASMLAQSYAGYDDRVSNGGEAKLSAFKPFVSGMLFDAAWLPGPPQDGSFDMLNDTWPASMKFFYEANWEAFCQGMFIDSANCDAADPDEYWASRPDMAQMLNMFPMMLQFDRGIYLSEGGTVIGTPTPGPQSAATYPGIADAINSGMGTMAMMMGMTSPDGTPGTLGAMMWSGQFFGMWVPPEMNPASPFYGEVGSLITTSHGIKGPSDPTLSDPNFCYSCHLTDDEYNGVATPGAKRLNFAQLGFTDHDGNGTADPLHDMDHTAKSYLTMHPDCAECHVATLDLPIADNVNTHKHDACTTCHTDPSQADFSLLPGLAPGDCVSCHDATPKTSHHTSSQAQAGNCTTCHEPQGTGENLPQQAACRHCHFNQTADGMEIVQYDLSRITALTNESIDPAVGTVASHNFTGGNPITIQHYGVCFACHGATASSHGTVAVRPFHGFYSALHEGNEMNAKDLPRIQNALHPGIETFRAMAYLMNNRNGSWNDKLYKGYNDRNPAAIPNDFGEYPEDIAKAMTQGNTDNKGDAYELPAPGFELRKTIPFTGWGSGGGPYTVPYFPDL